MESVGRKDPVYKMWRAKIYASDGWKCVVCSSKERIEAHHILPIRKYPKLILDESNGVTLCFKCHRLVYGKEEQLAKILTELKANRVNSVKSLTDEVGKANTEPSQTGNGLEGVTTRDRVFRIEQFVTQKVKCGWCKKHLERHYYRVKRSKNFFCSNECRNKWMVGKPPSNKRLINKRWCEFCKKEMQPTPSDPHRLKRYCSNSCHTKWMWSKKAYTRKSYLNGQWSKKYASCVNCQTTTVKHMGGGRCMTCYNKQYNAQLKDSNILTKALRESDDIV